MDKKVLFLLGSIILIFGTNLYCADDIRFEIQEPKGETMELVPFAHKLINFPFVIKYPEKWYAREEFAGIPSLFLTREPIRNITDRYTVGMGLFYQIDYFISQESPDSKLDQIAKTVVKVIDWNEAKKRFIESIKDVGNTNISQSELTITNQPALKVEYESKVLHTVTLYVKVGNHLLTMTFEASSQEYGQYKDIFEEMIKSFSFTR